MHQGDEDHIRRKAYEIWESEGRPEGLHDEHWRRAHDTVRQNKTATPTPAAGDGTPDVSAADQPGDLPSAQSSAEDMDTQARAMIPENGAQNLSQTAQPEPGSQPTPPAKRPRTQRKKTSPS